MTVASPEIMAQPIAGPSSVRLNAKTDASFDVVAAYRQGIERENYPHPIAAIMALVQLMEASECLARELKAGRQRLVDTQSSLGVRAGCQLWERFFAESTMSGGDDFPQYKKGLISQGKSFCTNTAGICREKIADLAVGFLRDDCTILTHSYSRTVMKTLLKAHKQNKRIKVYVTEAKPNCLGLRTYERLTAEGIPCTIVLDSAVAYVMERVDMVLVGSEAVVESGGLVSAVGTYQMGLIAKALSKPFYALAESYKFLRHYPLSQTDLPLPKRKDADGRPYIPLAFPTHLPHQHGHGHAHAHGHPTRPDNHASRIVESESKQHERDPSGRSDAHVRETGQLTAEMLDLNPSVDITTPDLIDFIITDLGAPLSPTSVSQYLVAQFSS